MNQTEIITLLKNSGLTVFGMDSKYIYFQDPTCIFPAFDSIFNFAWIVLLTFTAILLFGWGVLYIKNGVNLDSLFKNIRSLVLILTVFILIKPIVNVIYGDNLFAKLCDKKQVEISTVQELINQRNKKFSNSNQDLMSESFNVTDTGALLSPEMEAEIRESSGNQD